MTTTTNDDREVFPKTKDDFDEDDIRKAQSNAKAINLLYCALSSTEFNRISRCDIANQIWDMLQVTHEGLIKLMKLRLACYSIVMNFSK